MRAIQKNGLRNSNEITETTDSNITNHSIAYQSRQRVGGVKGNIQFNEGTTIL